VCKVKVILSLCLTKHHTTNTYKGSEGIAPRILNLGARWTELSASRDGRFTFGVTASGTHWTGGILDPMSRSGRGDEDRNSLPLPRMECVAHPCL
jgi:hypothetical protein